MTTEGLSAMASMSRAIRLEMEKHGPTLRDIPDDVLPELATITAAFAADLRDELRRRDEGRGNG
jgi:hypothetical protein